MFDFLKSLSNTSALFLFVIENICIVSGVILIGYLIQKNNRSKHTLKIHFTELVYAGISILINSGITFAGYVLWKLGYINFRTEINFRIIFDFFILILAMDFVMFTLHFIIHKSVLYKPIHSLHHRYINPEPIDLFVLSPFEAFSFGILWLILISIYTSSIYSVIAYLIVNVLFGMLGHLSVEPFPKSWLKTPVLKYICTSTFHWMHHINKEHNFGFYTTIWDKLANTLSPEYEKHFMKNKNNE